jgi:HD-like signal output (HDOD) protein
MLESELAVFGANHQQFGRALCEKWKFPSVFANVTGFHHRPREVGEGSRTMPCLIYVADRVSGGMEGGYRLDLPSLALDPEVLDELELDTERVERVAACLKDAIDETSLMLQ